MMEDKSPVENITSKIEILISRYEEVVASNDDLSVKLADCCAKLELKNQREKELTEKIKTLQSKIDNLQLVEAMKETGENAGNAEAVKMLDRLITQIDECIALLDI